MTTGPNYPLAITVTGPDNSPIPQRPQGETRDGQEDETMTTETTLTRSDLSCIEEFRRVRPTAADQRREPGLDLLAIWRDDIEHSIRCREIPADRAAAIRSALGVTA